MKRLRIAWLTSARGPGSFSALEYILAAIDRGLPVELAVVFVNRDPGEAEATDRLLELARTRGIPLEMLSSVRFRKARGGAISRPGAPLQPWRRQYDEEVAARLGEHDFELGVMFGYMLIATEPLFARFRLINDHPALPGGPVGTYQEVIRELIESGATESGCMVNVVSGDLDRGPALSFCRFPIRDASSEALWSRFQPPGPGAPITAYEATPLYQEIRRRGLERERPFLAETLRAVAGSRLAIPPAVPADLTPEVEAALRVEDG